ncbi:hypothetical protein JOQ06_005954 [Pogonophryne albipinna]|uniref:Uncharacterized protein n=1 Tax=Pogonophryne albipinna TaxID=1090488 RepID=A0AAD6BGK5_9TELE|nr:hypothetical protein JOQ06_005954 [Pogonophryne albipinna]
MWGGEESQDAPSAEGMIESSTGPEELNDTQPNPVSFSPVDPSRDHCLWLVTERRVIWFYAQQRGDLCTETAAGAAVTVAMLLLAPHCSQDEVHRCSHSVQWFIGCLKQCISVKNNSS